MGTANYTKEPLTAKKCFFMKNILPLLVFRGSHLLSKVFPNLNWRNLSTSFGGKQPKWQNKIILWKQIKHLIQKILKFRLDA